jgi:hypothetical protein
MQLRGACVAAAVCLTGLAWARGDEAEEVFRQISPSVATLETMEGSATGIVLDEEYALLAACGLRRTDRALIRAGGRSLDRMEVRDTASGPVEIIYFDVTRPLAWVEAHMNRR